MPRNLGKGKTHCRTQKKRSWVEVDVTNFFRIFRAVSTLHEKEFEGATLQARLTERRSPRRSLVGGANNANSQQQSQQQQQQVPITHSCYQISQWNLIQGKAQLALKNWKNLFGDYREDSLTSTEICYLQKNYRISLSCLPFFPQSCFQAILSIPVYKNSLNECYSKCRVLLNIPSQENLGHCTEVSALDFIKCEVSSLVCADICVNISFSFTWDSSKGFLLRHDFPSYVIYCVKVDDILTVNNREKAVVGWGRGGNPRLTISCIWKGKSTFTPSGNTRLLGVIIKPQ